MLYLALVLLFVAVILVVIQLYPERVKRKAEEEQMPALFQTLSPVIKYLANLNRSLPLPSLKQRYARKILRAGLSFDMSPEDFLAIKEMALVAVGGFALLTYFFVIHDWIVVLIGLVLGFFWPDARLSDMIKKRERAILRALPDFLDLLALSVEAGLAFVGAVRKVAERFEPGPLVWEFKAFLRDLRVGKPRDEALREMNKRVEVADFSSFANAVIQASEVGASIGPVLKMQAVEMRSRRFQRAEKMAHQAPVKMLFPLIGFIFPATFLMILAPIVIRFLASGIFNLF